MSAAKKSRPAPIERGDVWKVLRATPGLEDVARNALTAGCDGEAWWASLKDEHVVARVALAFGTLATEDVVRRAVELAAENDPVSKSLSFDAAPTEIAALIESLGAKSYASSRWAAHALLELRVGADADARFAALEALRLHQRDGSSSWAPRPSALQRWVAPCDLVDVVVDKPIAGCIAVRLKGGEVSPETVCAALRDAGVPAPDGFTGRTLWTEPDGLAVVHRPQILGAKAWEEAIAPYVEVRASIELGIAWRQLSGPTPLSDDRGAVERTQHAAALLELLTNACEASPDPAIRRAWRGFVRAWERGNPVTAGNPGVDGWRIFAYPGEAGAGFLAMWGAK